MSSSLRVDWCSYEAAKYACVHWHYAGRMSQSVSVRLGVWEGDRFIGAVVFARGATPYLLRPYGLKQTGGAELTRIALREHAAPVSRIMSIAVKMLRRRCPGLRLLVSFADPAQGHLGIVYQAAGWLYTGTAQQQHAYYRDQAGRLIHPRTLTGLANPRRVELPHMEHVQMPPKHRYLLPLDAAMRAAVLPLVRPYPKRVGGVTSSTDGDQPSGDGARPIPTLHSSERAG